jgi:hypothetical protein
MEPQDSQDSQNGAAIAREEIRQFIVPDTVREYWNASGEPKATSDDLARIEAAIGAKLARPYVDFVTEFGCIVFEPEVIGMRCMFDYTVQFDDRKETRESDIAFILNPDGLIKAWEIATQEEDEGLPQFPANYLPVGNDSGQGSILLELGEHAGRVWYWKEKECQWGTGDNTEPLGFVAEDFYEFINGLRSPPN